jgi:hypothetical protein
MEYHANFFRLFSPPRGSQGGSGEPAEGKIKKNPRPVNPQGSRDGGWNAPNRLRSSAYLLVTFMALAWLLAPDSWTLCFRVKEPSEFLCQISL